MEQKIQEIIEENGAKRQENWAYLIIPWRQRSKNFTAKVSLSYDHKNSVQPSLNTYHISMYLRLPISNNFATVSDTCAHFTQALQ